MKFPYRARFCALAMPSVLMALTTTAFANTPAVVVSVLWSEYIQSPNSHDNLISGFRIESTREVPSSPNLYEAQLQLRLQSAPWK